MIRKVNGQNLRIPGIGSDSAPTSSAGITILQSMYIPANTLMVEECYVLRTLFVKVGTSGVFTLRIYWNSSANLTGAILVQTYSVSAGLTGIPLYRHLVVKGSSSTLVLNPTGGSRIDIGDINDTTSDLSITTTTNGYFIATAQRVSGADSVYNSYITLEV